MTEFKISLLGKLIIQRKEHEFEMVLTSKARELLSYLVIHKDSPQSREILANILWKDKPTIKARRYLRQALWQLLSTLYPSDQHLCDRSIIRVEPEWLQFNKEADVWLDIEEFDRAYDLAIARQARQLDIGSVKMLETAINLYRGELLDGTWYEWCQLDREYFSFKYLRMLDLLMEYYEVNHNHERGIAIGLRILRHDQAHELAHRRLMRFYNLMGNRTLALRQYHHCIRVLSDEMGVLPAANTQALYDRIRSGHVDGPSPSHAKVDMQTESGTCPLSSMLDQLSRIRESLINTLLHLDENIHQFESVVDNKTP